VTASMVLWFGRFFGGGGERADDGVGRRHPSRASSARESESLPAGHPDSAIVRRVCAGDRDAFDTVVSTHFAMLARCAYTVLGSRDGAEDVAQEVLVDVWMRRESWAPRTGVRAYLLTAARHRALNRIRRTTVEQRHASAVIEEAPRRAASTTDLVFASDDAAARLTGALDQLSDQARQAVLLRYEEECTFPEVAGILGISLSAAQKLVQRALLRLRDLLTEPR
jgi:RNA polymerase sigma-70 factor (ECF subfamily)